MAAIPTQAYLQVVLTTFKAAADRIRNSTLLKIGEHGSETTIANRLLELRGQISDLINAHATIFPNLAAQWRNGTPFPALTPHPHPHIVNPNAQDERDITNFERKQTFELIERELHRYLVEALYTCARPTYHRRMEIDQPPLLQPIAPAAIAAHAAAVIAAQAANIVPPPPPLAPPPIIERGIYGQTLYEGWQALQSTVGAPRSANLNVLENTMRNEKQPPDVNLVEWLASFREKLAELATLGRRYEGRPCEAPDIFVSTITSPIYNEFIRNFLAEYYDDQSRTMDTLTTYVTQRAWTYEQQIGTTPRRTTNTVQEHNQDAEDPIHATTETSAASLARNAKPAAKPKPTTTNVQDHPVKTLLDITALNRQTLKTLGLKLVPIEPRKPTTTTVTSQPAATRATTVSSSSTYCWTHGVYPHGHRGAHDGTQCRNPKEGHRDDATLDNRLGGSNRNNK